MEGQLAKQEAPKPPENPLKKAAHLVGEKIDALARRAFKRGDVAAAGTTAMTLLGLGCNPNMPINIDINSAPKPPEQRIQGAAASTYTDASGQSAPIPDFKSQLQPPTPEATPAPLPPQISPAEIGSFHHLPPDRKNGVIITQHNGQEQISGYKVSPTGNKEQLWFEDQLKRVQERIGTLINTAQGPADLITANQEFIKGVNESYERSEIIESFAYLSQQPQNVIFDLKDSGANYELILDDRGNPKEEVLSLAVDKTGKRGPMTIKSLADVENTFNLEDFQIKEGWKDWTYEEPDGTKSVKGKEKTLFKQEEDKDIYVRVFFGNGIASIDRTIVPHIGDTPPPGSPR